ncbi:hypothetical protein DH2020_049766 [Rehmannia glutinosa]|uniref:Homeobox-leucine zipper protein n=1 Tax=Rehmannia glutinosa TaxID=99300 RepID=A0ABR0U1V6_REHGL
MEGCEIYDDSHTTNVLLNNERIPACSSQVLDSLWVPNSSPSFHGSASMVNFEDTNNTDRPFLVDTKVENCNDEFDGSSIRPEKKRRLSPNQVQFLEKSFEVENKLEPDRKIQLAKEIGLQPRQVAIWFQNRRARYKTKVLEKEYDSLKTSYDKLKADYDIFMQRMRVHLLTKKLHLQESAKPKPEPSDPISPLDHNFQPKNPIFFSQDNASSVVPDRAAYKHDDAASSARSGVFDSDSPPQQHYLEPANSCHVFEADITSDFSQDEDDSLKGSFCISQNLKMNVMMMICSQIHVIWGFLFKIRALGFGNIEFHLFSCHVMP